MIRQITEHKNLNINLLRKTWRGRKIYAYYKAYGLNYDFCQFYAVGENGILLKFNSTVLIVNPDEQETENLALFIQMHMPFRIECDMPVCAMLAKLLPEYHSLHRTTFELMPDTQNQNFEEKFVEFNPSLEQVYQILQAGFPNLQDYALWLTDTSHRCRHGVSHVLTYKNSTTATIMFDIDNYILIGQVATLPEARGLGHARMFLRWLAGWLAQFDKKAVLYALDIRESFYREIGFKIIDTEYVLELKYSAQDNIVKGLLDNA
ncbi:MAG: N-acetyltransferase [Oscillospiraceae bacterium]|nr:N-acetyltransferase [Oscillospiraceae bacterium]